MITKWKDKRLGHFYKKCTGALGLMKKKYVRLRKWEITSSKGKTVNKLNPDSVKAEPS